MVERLRCIVDGEDKGAKWTGCIARVQLTGMNACQLTIPRGPRVSRLRDYVLCPSRDA